MVMFVGDHVGDHSALKLGLLVSDQTESNGHQRVDISGLKKRRKQGMQIVYYCCISIIFPSDIMLFKVKDISGQQLSKTIN